MTHGARVLAIRHGETTWNVDTRIQGQLDVGLNDTGRWQAERLARALAEEPIRAIYASDLGRAHDTAMAISRVSGVAVTAEQGLRERHFGEFQGKTFAEIEAVLPEQARLWRTRDPAFAPTGGESLLQLRERVVATAEKLAARHAGELIVLVGHGGVMDVLYRAATRLDIQAPRTWALGNAAINRLLWTPDGFTLVGWADTQHLDNDNNSLDETTT
ncbi:MULTISPECIES: histidine phosphatase family protein [unclassified Polaromonas]|uniref:histidine phosphatase family protein n=1 Tax=unclassified Polaromonas TaxID=2638319 RepID=UPI000BC635C4|nr:MULTISPECIES: histidine phosphatase family protein [unclassified Polaromonas]OYY35804.1 MAG: histidine phosphatase family protein [Polaromonas sp. 35-63-35]OYZ19890.1 MAG: histidine phosphatase family protein [Polaromonas sp. 16-63-31]OYZ76134.1 MAG: histidine phosphatase family protein [Polaromonas sp. 24-63-21]OZA51959.1 MAG: histidine phosphatase family protein [Polaromonas sp. 17-63-33]OZA88008.1 MAG: histidine phosphatase family protein [Polaromonas sp. 39-63-25]